MPDATALGGGPAVTLDADVFGTPFNGPLVHEVVVAELAARRQGTHATKTRGMVSGGSATPRRLRAGRAGRRRADRGQVVPQPRPRGRPARRRRRRGRPGRRGDARALAGGAGRADRARQEGGEGLDGPLPGD